MTTKGNEGQSALVTGASGGIGLELARVLAANLFSLVLLARSRDKLEDLARELGAQHGTKVTGRSRTLRSMLLPRPMSCRSAMLYSRN